MTLGLSSASTAPGWHRYLMMRRVALTLVMIVRVIIIILNLVVTLIKVIS